MGNHQRRPKRRAVLAGGHGGVAVYDGDIDTGSR
jgi:hypothetical protein